MLERFSRWVRKQIRVFTHLHIHSFVSWQHRMRVRFSRWLWKHGVAH